MVHPCRRYKIYFANISPLTEKKTEPCMTLRFFVNTDPIYLLPLLAANYLIIHIGALILSLPAY